MTETPTEFQAALHYFSNTQRTKEPSEIWEWIKYYWQQHQTVLEYPHNHEGRLEDADFRDLEAARCILAENPDNGRDIMRRYFGNFEMREAQIDPFLSVLQGLLAGVAAAYHSSGWKQNTSKTLGDEALTAREQCFRQYHAVWDLWSRPVTSIANHAAAVDHPDGATAILDAFYKAKIQPSPAETDSPAMGNAPAWWTQSNWLLVRRLLSYLLGDEDSKSLCDDNKMQMLLVTGDDQRGYQGLTAPVTTSLREEGWNSAYLDPVSLGMCQLDLDMLKSLRIAARICRPDLHRVSKVASLRIALTFLPTGLLSVAGESAGGIVTVAACASAQKRRLDRDRTASFTVDVANVNTLKDVEQDLSIDEVQFGVVDQKSIRAKLTSEAFREAGLKAAYLCHRQKCKSQKWDRWVPTLEQELESKHQQRIRIYPVGEEESNG